MKKTIILLLSLFMSFLVHAQEEITTKQWQEDLNFLQSTIHSDYPFLFKKVSVEDFDKAVDQLRSDLPQLENHEIVVGIARLVSMFKYGHTDISFRRSPVSFTRIPFNLYHFSDGVYVQGVHEDYEQALGARVVDIEGVAVEEALKAIYPVVPSENDQYFKAFGINYLRIPEVLHAQGVLKTYTREINVGLEKDGKQFNVTFTALEDPEMPIRYSLLSQENGYLDVRETGNDPLYLKNLEKIYFYEYLEDHKTLYVRHSQIQDDPSEDIPTFYERVFDFVEGNDVEKLVIDVRLNGGGNNYKNKPIVTGIIESEKINQVGKLFVIIGRRTFSACQNLVNELDNYTNAIFVGEPTAENINFYGDTRRINLPNTQLPVYLSFAWWQDKPQWENEDWLAPHVAVDMSFEEYKTNRDPVLDAVLQFDDNDLIIDPMGHLTSLFMSGEMEKLAAEAERLVKDDRYRFFNFEDQFNRAGYNLLGSGSTDAAIYVFEMNKNLFPKSANAWDSLAEGYLKAGKKDLAIKYYNKAIELDPAGGVGDNARIMLSKISEEE